MNYTKDDVETVEHHIRLGDWLETFASREFVIAQKVRDQSRHRNEIAEDLNRSVAMMKYTYEHYELVPKKPTRSSFALGSLGA